MIVLAVILDIYKWIVYTYLNDTYDRRRALTWIGMNKFSVNNDSQVFYSKPLGQAYIEVGSLYSKCNCKT